MAATCIIYNISSSLIMSWRYSNITYKISSPLIVRWRYSNVTYNILGILKHHLQYIKSSDSELGIFKHHLQYIKPYNRELGIFKHHLQHIKSSDSELGILKSHSELGIFKHHLQYIKLSDSELRIFKHNLQYIDGLVQERCKSIANALELPLSCTNPLISSPLIVSWGYSKRIISILATLPVDTLTPCIAKSLTIYLSAYNIVNFLQNTPRQVTGHSYRWYMGGFIVDTVWFVFCICHYMSDCDIQPL